MFKLSLSLCFLILISHAFTLHNFLPSEVAKRNIYTNFVPPSGERFFAPAAASSVPAPATKQAQTPLVAGASAPYFAAYATPSTYPYQPQYSPYAFKQYPSPYYPGVFYPPQQFVYPGAVGPSPVVYIPRYPAPAESGNEQGSSSGSQGGWGNYFPSNWQSWGSNWGSYLPNWPGSGSETAEGASPGTPAQGSSSQAGASASSKNKPKPEKIEIESSPAPSQDSAKLQDSDKNAVTVELPEQQYVLLGQPQFFGHFAAFPADRDPTTLNGAAKGAVSSFLFYDQNQQAVPQRLNDISNSPASASLAYQRFLLLSKQRSDDGPKPANKPESQPSPVAAPAQLESQKEQSQSNSTSADAVAASSSTSSDATSPQPQPSLAQSAEDGKIGGEIAQVTPNAVAYAGIGGVAGAAPVGTAFIANSGLASSAPRATAIAGTSDQSPDFSVVPARTISIARYTPQRKYHIDTIAHRVDIDAASPPHRVITS